MSVDARSVEGARLRQRRGADPANSAFVMANAGSGKTRVLTERVARMLLNRVDPQQILCITFTKAAAAEMSERLFRTLGEWALIDDKGLHEKLAELEGDDAVVRDAAALLEVRRLFARALETPGGLKIQTIHSFCEGMLKRFPLEAGVPPGFSVIEDGETHQLLVDAIDELAQSLETSPELRSDIVRLSARSAETELRALLKNGTGNGLKLNAMFERYGGLDGCLKALAGAFGVNENTNDDEIAAAFIGTLDEEKLHRARDALLQGSVNANKLGAAPIQVYLETADNDEKWSALKTVFLTDKGAPRKKLGDKKTFAADAWAESFLYELQAAFVSACEKIKALAIYQDSAAYLRLVAALRALYDQAKAARAALDFDDLIMRARDLLQNESEAWVRYKLDFGIDHILVDETQDTSPEQWSVIGALVNDYLSGAGARHIDRTFFAVGDVKQSIYSFQGANADVFEEQETDLGKRLAAYHGRIGGAYEKLDMQMSFRTTAPVLTFVDQVFIDADARAGLGKDGAPPHFVHRTGQAGLVEIWPLTPRLETEKTNAWDAPVDAPAPDEPVERLCQRVASTIADWLKNGEILQSENRPVRPDDVLILVQTRGRVFEGVLRALGVAGVPAAGADRLKLLEDPAVEDLLSFMKFCVQPLDDLSLAEVLKSPLFDFDDDADLFPLAHERMEEESLWSSLVRRAASCEKWKGARHHIEEARGVALSQGAYAFLTHVLETGLASGVQSGRRLFNARLSQTSRDGIDEMLRYALAFERDHPRSVRGFIEWFGTHAAEVKREMERGDNAVRVMTVHGAKGLEANIVFLIDAHRDPSRKKLDQRLELVDDSDTAPRIGRLWAIAGAKDRDSDSTAAARVSMRAKQFEEYRRLFYVAATRARDRLYIAGAESGNERDPRARTTIEKSWHSLAMDAFDEMSAAVETDTAPFWEGADAPRQRLVCPQTADTGSDEPPQEPLKVKTPTWLNAVAPKEPAPPRLSPSRLAEEEEADSERALASTPVYSPAARDNYFRGRVLHRLLELLPEVDAPLREGAADRLFSQMAPDIPVTERNAWREEVIAVLESVDFAAVFAPGSRAEVGIAGEIDGVIVSGQIDRLLVEDEKILVVDYKTNRPPPDRASDTAPAYLAQMAAYRALLQKIYPGHQVECALLWTFTPRLMPLAHSLLDEAYRRWVVPG